MASLNAKQCNIVAPICWSFQGAHRFHYMALNIAPSHTCMPSLLTSGLENHFDVFALQAQIQIHGLTFALPCGLLTWISTCLWATCGLKQCQAAPHQLLGCPLLNYSWFSSRSNKSLFFCCSPCWPHWNTGGPWLHNVVDHVPSVTKYQRNEVNWVWISVLHVSTRAPCIQGCIESSVWFWSMSGLWHPSVDVTNALQWAAAQGYALSASRVHIQFFLWWTCKMSGFHITGFTFDHIG